MKNRNLFLILILLLCSIFLFEYVQNTYFLKTNLLFNYEEINSICHSRLGISPCESIINLSEIPSFYSGKIPIDVLKLHNLFFISSRLFLLLIMIILSIILIKKNWKYCNDNTFKLTFKQIFIFSLLSSYKFIYLYANNINDVPFYWGITIIFPACLIFFILFKIINYIIKNQYKAVLISLVIAYILYNTGSICISVNNIFHYTGVFLLILTYILSINTGYWINFLKNFTLTLLILSLIQGGYKIITSINFAGLFFEQNKTSKISESNITRFPKNDIFIIVLDMYAGSYTLNQMGFDNSYFINSLKKSDFNVFENIESNYNKTFISLPSFLNLKYVEDINYETPSDAINYAELFKMAKSAGYEIYYINSWPVAIHLKSEIIDNIYDSDYYVTGEILNLFLHNTIFKNLIYMAEKANPVENSLSIMKQIIENKSSKKKFVLAHFLMPHEPFLFDEFENELPVEARNYITYKNSDLKSLNQKSYISFLQYANKKTLEMINEILNTDKKTKPIIIVTGDHGPRIIKYDAKEENHMEEVSYYHKNNFNTFLAYYNSEANTENYSNTNSLLNFFINFSNEVFGTKKENLPDKKFYIYMSSFITKIHELEGEPVQQ